MQAARTRPMVLAVDVDGTLCEYHEGAPAEIGKPLPGFIDEMKKIKAAGWIISIWTVRPATLELALKLEAYGMPFDFINENPYGPKNGSNKIYADVYLDDKGFHFDGVVKGLAEKILNFKPWHKAPPLELKKE